MSTFAPEELKVDDDGIEVDADTADRIEISGLRIGLDVPLEARIAYIPPIDIGLEPATAAAIAEELNINDRRVFRLLKELGIEPETKIIHGVETSVYPPYTAPVLREEVIWRDTYRDLPAYMPVTHIAEQLGRSVGGTQRRIEVLGIPEKIIRPPKHAPYVGYTKKVVKYLREEDMSIPPSHDWLTIGQLEKQTGYDRGWILNRLAEEDISPQERWSSLTGRALQHFPPESFSVLYAAHSERPKPAGTWMTPLAIEQQLCRSRHWVKRRLERYVDVAEVRQDDAGQSRLHYPPFVLDELRILSEQQSQLSEKGDNLNLIEVSRALGRTATWVSERSRSAQISTIPVANKVGRVLEVYQPTAVEELRVISESEKEGELANRPTVTDHVFAVESLRSRIRAQKTMLSMHKEPTNEANQEQVDELNSTLDALRKELRIMQARMYKAQKKN